MPLLDMLLADCSVLCCAVTVCCCRYTSGTTGDPKGVLLKHSAVIATVTSLQAFLESGNFHLGPGDSTLSYLPLAHIFDRCVGVDVCGSGFCGGMWMWMCEMMISLGCCLTCCQLTCC
jgi:long-subunit acyl-CoA synthetase (AMP-forming)